MRKLLLFLARYSMVGLFLLLETASFAMYVSNGRYAQSVFFSSSNGVAARLLAVGSYVSDFFGLRANNAALNVENAALKEQVLALENRLALVQAGLPDSARFLSPERENAFIPARIIGNTTGHRHNYITLNRGARDGVRADMGVVGAEGVVGIVRTVSDRFATVISVLNPAMQVNCKIKRSNYYGPLEWDGLDYRYARLMDIPHHVVLYAGDTIVTSGLTPTFPEGIPVGVIESYAIEEGDAFYKIQVRLCTDFRRVSDVQVIDYKHYDEQTGLEEENVERKKG